MYGSLSLGAMVLFASACVLVEDFDGYQPVGAAGACVDPSCENGSSTSGSSTSGSSGLGGMGSGSSSGSGGSIGSSSSSGSPMTRCAAIPCNGTPCNSEELAADAQDWLVAVDTESFFLRTAAPSHIVRIAKPGCTIAKFDQAVDYTIPEQGVASDGQYVAWMKLDIAGTCAAPTLTFCEAANCQPQNIPIPQAWAEQGSFARLAFGPNHLYFTMRNGLIGRVAKGSTQPEQIGLDPATQPMSGKRGYLSRFSIADDGKLAILREFIENSSMDPCSGGSTGDTGAILLSDATPGAIPEVVAPNLNFPTAVAVSQKYVYFHITDNVTVLHRVPRAGGPVEKIGTNGTIGPTLNTGIIFVNKGWVYFRIALPNSMHGIARLPAEAPNFSLEAAEVVVGGLFFRTFHIDDDAIYWDSCVDMACNSRRVLARVMQP